MQPFLDITDGHLFHVPEPAESYPELAKLRSAPYVLPVPLALVLLVLCLVALLALRPISKIRLQAEPVGEPAVSEPTR